MEIQDVFDYLKNELHIKKEIRLKKIDFYKDDLSYQMSRDFPVKERKKYIGIYLTDPTSKELVLIGEVEI